MWKNGWLARIEEAKVQKIGTVSASTENMSVSSVTSPAGAVPAASADDWSTVPLKGKKASDSMKSGISGGAGGAVGKSGSSGDVRNALPSPFSSSNNNSKGSGAYSMLSGGKKSFYGNTPPPPSSSSSTTSTGFLTASRSSSHVTSQQVTSPKSAVKDANKTPLNNNNNSYNSSNSSNSSVPRRLTNSNRPPPISVNNNTTTSASGDNETSSPRSISAAPETRKNVETEDYQVNLLEDGRVGDGEEDDDRGYESTERLKLVSTAVRGIYEEYLSIGLEDEVVGRIDLLQQQTSGFKSMIGHVLKSLVYLTVVEKSVEEIPKFNQFILILHRNRYLPSVAILKGVILFLNEIDDVVVDAPNVLIYFAKIMVSFILNGLISLSFLTTLPEDHNFTQSSQFYDFIGHVFSEIDRQGGNSADLFRAAGGSEFLAKLPKIEYAISISEVAQKYHLPFLLVGAGDNTTN